MSRTWYLLLENLARTDAEVGQGVQGLRHAEGGGVDVHTQAGEAAVKVGRQVVLDQVVDLGSDVTSFLIFMVSAIMTFGFVSMVMTVFFVGVSWKEKEEK